MAEAGMRNRGNREEYTMDGTANLKGSPFLRSKGGRWSACFFLIASEFLERIALYGIVPNLIVYLSDVLHKGTVAAANDVNNWNGTLLMTTLAGGCVADAYLGRYWAIFCFTVIDLLGMCSLTLSVSLPSLRPKPCISPKEDDCRDQTKGSQIAFFYCSLYVVAVGAGGRKANTTSLGADQFDEFEPKERAQKLSFFNWWSFAMFSGVLFACTVLLYIQDNISWLVGYIIATSALAFSLLSFMAGTPYYRHKKPHGSPFTRFAMVLVAATRKWKASTSIPSVELYELDSEQYLKEWKQRIDHTDSLKFLDRAAVKNGSDGPWRLCPVTQVEEAKRIIKLLPVFFVTLMPSVTIAHVLTLFIKQATTLDGSLGDHFSIPPASLISLFTVANLITIVFYDKLVVPMLSNKTGNPRGFTLLQKIGIGQAMHIVIMLVAFKTENWRLRAAKSHELPSTVFVLLPQFVLMGVAESFVGVGKLEFFYDQAPEGMKSVGSSLFWVSMGVGSFLSSILLSTVVEVTTRHGGISWIQDSLSESRLDYYYGLLAVLNAINFFAFLVVAKHFVYNRDVVLEGDEDEETAMLKMALAEGNEATSPSV
ncbi:hypothetical protein HPP92_006130 [Vanilla planifolia]|uniref:Uncharacterized protein n=1 Tax=Vanilla planifolia TaxID=51239 RepID=A0A835RUZ9_VANPL|nr:hypothetical protein HPP92_006130 [Vanilla planifolia]